VGEGRKAMQKSVTARSLQDVRGRSRNDEVSTNGLREKCAGKCSGQAG
jgi:hypothetical protein